MKVITVYARIYGQAFTNALAAIVKNAWTLLLPMGLAVAWLLVTTRVGSAMDPWSGGMVIGLARSAALSIYCFFLGGLVAQQKVGLDQLKTSIGTYFWSWLNIFFVLWIASLVLTPVFAANPNLSMPLTLVLLIALNTVPETIYLKGTRGGIDTITRSFAFMQENWIEWFVPNGIVLGLVVVGMVFATVVSSLLGTLGAIGSGLLLGIFLHIYAVFRGFLYEALDGSTHRQRMFRFRNS
ncbi:MAG: hypothetical protein JNM69_16375 [Archangium sp.]|nr:hypothetical protein [Archangium sp.]